MSSCMRLFIAVVSIVLAVDFNNAFAGGSEGFKFGFDDRVRYEYMSDYRFNNSQSEEISRFFNRLRVNFGYSYKEILDLYSEVLDGREWVDDTVKSGQEDDLDLHQFYIKLKSKDAAGLSIKLGRQTLCYGKGRLIAAPSWGNKIRSFDAAVLGLKSGNWNADVIYGSVVNYDSGNFNESDFDSALSGIYSTYKSSEDMLLDVYFINQSDETGTNDLKRNTAGARIQVKNSGGPDFDFEAAYQFGDLKNLDIKACALALSVELKTDSQLISRIACELNYASGDSNPQDNDYETFVPVYQTTHAPYGITDFFRWQNMMEAAFNVSMDISKSFRLQPEFHLYWLADKNDSWYKSSGSKFWNNTGGNNDSYAGSEISLTAKYKVNNSIKFEAGYSYFLFGDVGIQSGDDNGVHFAYLQGEVSY